MVSPEAATIGARLDEHHSPEANGRMAECKTSSRRSLGPSGGPTQHLLSTRGEQGPVLVPDGCRSADETVGCNRRSGLDQEPIGVLNWIQAVEPAGQIKAWRYVVNGSSPMATHRGGPLERIDEDRQAPGPDP